MWLAIDGTYYMGGQTTVDGIAKDNRISNTRLEATILVPTGKKSGLKLSFSKVAVVLVGTDFSTVTLLWK